MYEIHFRISSNKEVLSKIYSKDQVEKTSPEMQTKYVRNLSGSIVRVKDL